MMRKGKMYCWILAASVALMMMGTTGLAYNAYGVFFTPLSEGLKVGYGLVSLHSTIYFISYGILGPFVIRLIEKGYNYQKLMIFGIILICGSTFLMSVADKIWLFYILAFFKGVGFSFVSNPVLTMVLGNWFYKDLGKVSAVVMSFSGIGGAIFSPILSSLISAYGYKTCYLFCAIVIFILALPGIFLIKITPGELGMMPFGERKEEVKPAESDRSFSYTSAYFILMSLIFILYVSTASIASHIVTYSLELGKTALFGSALLSIINLFNVLGKFILGYLSDQFGIYKASFLTMFLSLSGMILFLFGPKSEAVLYAAAVLYGFMYSFGSVGITLVTRSVFGESGYGKAFAGMSAIGTPFMAVATTLFGAIYDLTGSYKPAWLLCVVSVALSIVLLKIVKEKGIKWYNVKDND